MSPLLAVLLIVSLAGLAGLYLYRRCTVGRRLDEAQRTVQRIHPDWGEDYE